MSTKIPSPIETAVDEFIKAANVSFSVALVGATKRDDWECDEWRVTIKTARIELTTEYFTGTGHRVDTVDTRMRRAHLKGCRPNSIAWQNMLKQMKPQAPCAASVLYSLGLDGAASAPWEESDGHGDVREVSAYYGNPEKRPGRDVETVGI